MKKIVLVYIIIMVLLAGGVLAVPPVTQTITQGYDTLNIVYPKIDYYPKDQTINLHFHVFNASGYPLYNDTTICGFHFYNYTGVHLVENDSISFDSNQREWVYTIPPAWTELEKDYTYIIWCNESDTHFGFVSDGFEISRYGVETKHNTSGVTIAIAIILITLTIISFSFMYFFQSLDLKLTFGLLCYLMIIIDLYFSYVFIVMIDSSQIDIINNVLTIYNIALTGFKFAIGIIIPILVLRAIIYLNNLRKKNDEKNEEWGMG